MRTAETATAGPETGDTCGAYAAASSATDHDEDNDDDDATDDPAAAVQASSRLPEAAAARCRHGHGEAGAAAAVKSGILSSVTHFVTQKDNSLGISLSFFFHPGEIQCSDSIRVQ